MIYTSFIPVLFAFFAALASFKSLRLARILWIIAAALVIIWTCHHGAHHLPDLQSLGSW